MKRFFSLFIAAILIACVFPTIVSAENLNACGENVSWYFDDETGILHIEGSGGMYDYSYIEDNQPWSAVREEIKALDIGNGITYIGAYAFERLKIETVAIPASVVTIGEEAFNSCRFLTEVVMECEGIQLIGKGAFSGCSNLKDLTLPKSNAVIGDYAFFSTAIEHLVLPEGIVSVGVRAFDWCDGLKEITVMGDLKSIGEYAFSGNEALSSVKVNGSIAEIETGAFSGCVYLSEFAFKGTEIIGDNAFYGCMRLLQLDLPESLTSIGEYAFENIGISELYIPNNVKSVGRCAFTKCISLDKVLVLGEETLFDYGVLNGGNENVTVYCHKASKTLKYCETYDIIYKILGDIDGDRVVDAADTVIMRKILLGNESEYDLFAADINCDKVCDVLDLIKLKKTVA